MESTFASRVLEFRRSKGLSQKAFAERCDLEQGNITQMEKGTEPKQSNVAKLLAGFPDLSADWLLLGNGSMLRNGQSLEPMHKPTLGLTSGAAVVAESETLLKLAVAEANLEAQVKQLAEKDKQIADKEKLIDRLWNMIPAALGKMISNLDAAGLGAGVGREVSILQPA